MNIRHSNFDSESNYGAYVTWFEHHRSSVGWVGRVVAVNKNYRELPCKFEFVDYVRYQCFIVPGPTQLKRLVRALDRGLIDPMHLTWPYFGGKSGGLTRNYKIRSCPYG